MSNASGVQGLSAFPTRRVRIRSVEYAITDSGGSGAPVLLLHGWPDDRTIWHHQVAYLHAAGYRAIAVDWIGHGESSSPARVSRYHVTQLGADTIALLDALKIPQVHLVAHDYGATVSWETVANYPDRFLSYCALSVGQSVEILKDILAGNLLHYHWLVLHSMDRASRYWYLHDDARRFRARFASHPDADRIFAKLTRGEDRTFWTIWERANPAHDVLYRHFIGGQRQRRISVPTMGLYGRDDEWMTEGQLARCRRYVDATWRFASLAGGHWFQLERSEAVNTMLHAWLAETDSAPPHAYE